MDEITGELAARVSTLNTDSITEQALDEATKRVVDSIGCALGGSGSPPVAAARATARRVRGSQGDATIYGSGEKTTPEMAAFVNTAMTRYLDFNDTYVGARDGGHPSDMIPAILAAAEVAGNSGATALLAIIAAYEAFCPFIDAVPPRVRGWDHGIFTVLGTAIGVGKVLGLTEEQLAEAASLAVSPNVPTRQARAGDLTMWKGCATAAATRSGVFAAYLAEDGMRGPSQPFTGLHGIMDNVADDRSARPSYGGEGRPYHVELAHLKSISVEYHLQAPALAAIQLREKVDPRDIIRLSIATYKDAYTETGMEPEKWRPASRETADHSMPYVVAVALIDGEVSPRSFAPNRIADPAVHELMDKISVIEDPAITAEFPSTMKSTMEVVTAHSVLPWETDQFPKGHVQAPMSRVEIEAKFLSQAVPVLGIAAGQELLSLLWQLRAADSVMPVMDLLSATADRSI